jgi:threonine/homoserine/homoserine lactone efflux protein
MDISIILTVIFIWTIAVIVPGPNFFITIQSAISKENSSAFFVVLGIVVGTFVWAVLSLYGLALVLENAPNLYMVFKVIGGIYLIYLGVKLIVSKDEGSEVALDKEQISSYGRSFFVGFLTNLSNPKTAMFITSLFATVTTTDTSSSMVIVSIFLILLISTIWYSLVVLVFKKIYFKELYIRFKKAIEYFSGSIFIFFGTKSILAE